jgi:hypothetical protein
MRRKGWIVWTWGKMGGLMVFMGMMVMMLTIYSFVGAASQSESANQLARSLRNRILDTYNSVGDMSFEYGLPESLESEDYSIEVQDKEGNTAGIIVRTNSGPRQVSGGASLSLPMHKSSFGMLKDFNEELHYICIVRHLGEVYLERSMC